MVAYKVIDREVEPNVALATDALVDPVHTFLLDGVHHAIARPHHLDAWTKVLSQSVEIYVALSAPRTIIDGGTEQERRHITMFAHKDRVYIVEELSLFLTARTFTRDVVEEDSKRADAKTIHLLKFVHKIVAIFIRPFDIESRVDCPIEVYPTLVRTDIEFLEQFCFILRICLAPMLTVIRIIFRTIDVDIHLVATIEVNLSQAVFVTPRTTIETFDGAAEFHIGPVLDGASLELSFGNHVA